MRRVIQLVLICLAMQFLAILTADIFCILYIYFRYGIVNIELANQWATTPIMWIGYIYMGGYLWLKGYLQNDGRLYALPSISCLIYCLGAGISAIFLVYVLMDRLTFLPDWTKGIFDQSQSGWMGILCIAIFGPLVEELLFRGAITKILLQQYKPLSAILLSGLIFGIFHLNPAQVVVAIPIGFLLAWLYYRTGSILPGLLIHILNNGMCVYFNKYYPELDSRCLETTPLLVGIACALLLLIFSLQKIEKGSRKTTR